MNLRHAWCYNLQEVSCGNEAGIDDRFGVGQGQVRRQRCLRRAHRPLPPGAPCALLPDPRIVPGRRGLTPGDAVVSMAGTRLLRWALATGVAVPHRYQPVPEPSPGLLTPPEGHHRD